jgi:hypothetical protein
MSFGTVISLVICLSLLTLRFVLAADRRKRTRRERTKFVRMLLSAGLALAAVYYVLQGQIRDLDGTAGHEPSFVERMVTTLAGK